MTSVETIVVARVDRLSVALRDAESELRAVSVQLREATCKLWCDLDENEVNVAAAKVTAAIRNRNECERALRIARRMS